MFNETSITTKNVVYNRQRFGDMPYKKTNLNIRNGLPFYLLPFPIFNVKKFFNKIK